MRVSFIGGGSDIPAFYEKSTGAVISTSINKYIYISVHPYFHKDKILLKYSKTEEVSDIKDIKHPLIRNAFQLSNSPRGIELSSSSDIPAGTGLGSSSSFTVGVLNALNFQSGKEIDRTTLAKMACEIEIERLKEPIGKQDQYASSLGGLNFIEFFRKNKVHVHALELNKDKLDELQNNLFMFYTGGSRSANEILSEQSKSLKSEDTFRIQKQMVDLAYIAKGKLISGDFDDFGKLLNENWILKRQLTKRISNSHVDEIYEAGINSGASGGKLLGAGGSGFVLFYCKPQHHSQLINNLSKLRRLEFKFEKKGTSVVYSDNRLVNYEFQ